MSSYTQALYKNRWCDIIITIDNNIIIDYNNQELKLSLKDINEFR